MAATALAIAVIVSVTGCGHPKASPTPAVPFSTDLGAGAAAQKLGDLNGARQLFLRAVALQPGSELAHYDLGSVYQAEGDNKDALAQYAAATRIDPDDVSAQFNRAVIYTHTDAPLADFLYRRVITLQPDAPTAYLNLGLLESSNRSARARTQGLEDLARAVKLQPALLARLPAGLRSKLHPATPHPATPHPGSTSTDVPTTD